MVERPLPQARKDDARIAGLDYLRVFALGLVLLQHGLTVVGRTDLSHWDGYNFGQVGVGLFLVLSGALAGVSNQPAGAWLWRRLVHVFPPYWVALAASFALAWAFDYKRFDASQVVSQMLGLGMFTHKEDLVNSATWFVSLLLVCYLLAFLARASGRPVLVASGLIVACGVASGVGWEPSPCTYAIGFLAAFAIAWETRLRSAGLACGLAAAACALGVATLHREMVYPAVGCALLGLGLQLTRPVAGVRRLADLSYEVYLVHGLVFVGTAQLLSPSPLVVFPVGLAGALVGAWLLRRVVDRLRESAVLGGRLSVPLQRPGVHA